ncbi:hypothetical protein [Streptomyces sp. HUAS TT7]|uniref:hypothetical protein n=1 Tax=Streptomyces sp. HUAS TT7 TaxID=3447507 RepID=UPI003F658573
MTVVMPAVGFGLVLSAWGGGVGAAVPVFVLGVSLAVGLLTAAGLPARTVVPLCSTVPRTFGWAVLVFVFGTLGVLAGLAAYAANVDLGSAGTRTVLAGAPYVVVAALFVPNRWVRLGAAVALVAAVVYGGIVGPAQAQQRKHQAEVARYRAHSELLLLGAAPPGMEVSRAQAGPASFVVEYRPVRAGYETGYADLSVRVPAGPAPRCLEPADQGATCTVNADGEMRIVHDFAGGGRNVSLTRRQGKAEVEVTSSSVDEPGLRHLLNTLHPLSDAELDQLMRDKKLTTVF